MPPTPEKLFTTLATRNEIPPTRIDQTWQNLAAKYSEPLRHYHNLAHIERMIQVAAQTTRLSDAIALAILFHDSIYNPLDDQNEANSAEYFSHEMGSLLKPKLTGTIIRLILATNLKIPRTDLPDENLIIDADLSILAAPPAEYQTYRAAIRQEYSAFPDAEFRKGRAAVLNQFLAHRIFRTNFFLTSETQARLNIQEELNSLGFLPSGFGEESTKKQSP